MKKFTLEEIGEMALALTIKKPQTLDKIHNGALVMFCERARLLAEKEDLEGKLADNNVVSINKNKPTKGGK